MYICICNNITDTTLKQQTTKNSNNIKELITELNMSVKCGKCIPHIKDIINKKCCTSN
jgi:bacterioferritin-associated ferredoxin